MEEFKTGFIGCGNMAYAIIGGLQQAGVKSIYAYDKNPEQCQRFSDISVCDSVSEVIESADIIFLCVKPNIIPQILQSVTIEGKAFVSIAAGVTTEKIKKNLNTVGRVMRIMPNTPLLVGKGAIVIEQPTDFTDNEHSFIKKVFSTLGVIEYVDGNLMDSVTGVSGSGPAYVYMFINALAKAGEKHGLPKETALRLAVQTFEGACEMLKETKETPEQLIHNVCSPGGTTVEAMKVFETEGTYEIVEKAVDACVARSKELSQ